ncbi:hypothetical protein PR202_gb06287 [Eleusine coracana subsp. coracana]|uniref:Uncharacterized protein n=1 Tax=Eleusine coracana subsp. coracana TaxID=191504 RepID=A0AAV5E984_ELECO|nr:hypothetical protein PR202_gb06287 [Eleusine coracana subsp. coracana]
MEARLGAGEPQPNQAQPGWEGIPCRDVSVLGCPPRLRHAISPLDSSPVNSVRGAIRSSLLHLPHRCGRRGTSIPAAVVLQINLIGDDDLFAAAGVLLAAWLYSDVPASDDPEVPDFDPSRLTPEERINGEDHKERATGAGARRR